MITITQIGHRLTPTELYVVTAVVSPSGRTSGPQYDVAITDVSGRAWPDESYELVGLDAATFRGMVERAGQSWSVIEERLIDEYESDLEREHEWLIMADTQRDRDIDAFSDACDARRDMGEP